ncbi:hypothetical protein [Mucilaginibacter kameinonensis]|uniref:hypothetical protein n=1 Tax=Mucilaginibacter kameinonensis TaxID=452286 RepID=UPI000EF78D72|nr:hypothetical protein [Mucilaginibacter kameinonensis]
MTYRSSKSRNTKQQEKYNLLTDEIYDNIRCGDQERDAGTLWLDMNEPGKKISHTTFNNRLRKLVNEGLVEKISLGYNKHFYRVNK